MLIPFDKIDFGKHVSKYFGAYNKDLLFHQSAIQSLVQQNLYKLIQNRKNNLDMAEFAHKAKYQGSPLNITLPQLQIPVQYRLDQRYLEVVQKEHLNGPDYFVNFNSFSALYKKRHPVRHTYIVRGLNSLAAKNESHRTFMEQYENFIWTNIPYERGM